MVKTIYKCDKCGKEWDASTNIDQPVMVGIVVKFGATELSHPYPTYGQMWCRSCLIGAGVVEPCMADKDAGRKAPEQPLSFEEKFTLLLEEIGFVRD